MHLDRTGFLYVLTWELGNFSVMEGSLALDCRTGFTRIKNMQ